MKISCLLFRYCSEIQGSQEVKQEVDEKQLDIPEEECEDEEDEYTGEHVVMFECGVVMSHVRDASPGWIQSMTGRVSTGPPVVQVDMEDLCVRAGQSATFSVVITGQPGPEVRWYKVRENPVN